MSPVPALPGIVSGPLRPTLEGLVRAARGGEPVLIGRNWRLRADLWPDQSSDECLIFEVWRGDDWYQIAVLKPDGTWGY